MTNTTSAPSPYYITNFNNPALAMSIKLKDCSTSYNRFVDFQAEITFPVQSDNSIQINSFQFKKIMDIISMELGKFVKDGFPPPKQQVTENKILIKDKDMNNSLPAVQPQTFVFESDKQIRTLTKNNEIYFVAKDVAEALEYSWKGIATISHVPEQWRGVYSVQTPPANVSQEMLCLTEQGVNFFVFRSDKPKALPFQMWLAGEVLPSIRRTGSYVHPDAAATLPSISAQELRSIIETAIDAKLSQYTVLPSVSRAEIKHMKAIPETNTQTFDRFFEDRCLIVDTENDKLWTKAKELYAAFKQWCKETGISPMQKVIFRKILLSKFEEKPTGTDRHRRICGVALNSKGIKA